LSLGQAECEDTKGVMKIEEEQTTHKTKNRITTLIHKNVLLNVMISSG